MRDKENREALLRQLSHLLLATFLNAVSSQTARISSARRIRGFMLITTENAKRKYMPLE